MLTAYICSEVCLSAFAMRFVCVWVKKNTLPLWTIVYFIIYFIDYFIILLLDERNRAHLASTRSAPESEDKFRFPNNIIRFDGLHSLSKTILLFRGDVRWDPTVDSRQFLSINVCWLILCLKWKANWIQGILLTAIRITKLRMPVEQHSTNGSSPETPSYM